MATDLHTSVEIAPELIEAIENLASTRTVSHCGDSFEVSRLALYAACPVCGTTLKLRGYSTSFEIEGVVDAVFRWIIAPETSALARERLREIQEANR